MLNLGAPDAIVYSEADAQEFVAASPGRQESYAIERCDPATLLTGPRFAPFAERLWAQLAAGDTTSLMLRDQPERMEHAR